MLEGSDLYKSRPVSGAGKHSGTVRCVSNERGTKPADPHGRDASRRPRRSCPKPGQDPHPGRRRRSRLHRRRLRPAGAGPMRVEIWSDVVCPWCYIGKRRFERAVALTALPSRSRSCGAASSSTLTIRAGCADAMTNTWRRRALARRVKVMNERVIGPRRGGGPRLRLRPVQVVNTFDAHRVAHLAASQGLATRSRSGSCVASWSRARSSTTPRRWSGWRRGRRPGRGRRGRPGKRCLHGGGRGRREDRRRTRVLPVSRSSSSIAPSACPGRSPRRSSRRRLRWPPQDPRGRRQADPDLGLSPTDAVRDPRGSGRARR